MRHRRKNYDFLGPSGPRPDIAPLLRVGIVLPPDFTLMSLSCFVEFLRFASDESDFSRQVYCAWSLLTESGRAARASCGVQLRPQGSLAEADPRDFDYVVVAGRILHSRTAVPEELYRFIAAAHAGGVPVVGLCTGAFIMAETGMLDDRRCAVHFSLEETMRRLFPKIAPVIDRPVVVDGSVITCPGGLAAINLGAFLVEERCGHARVYKALQYLLANPRFIDMRGARREKDLALERLDRRLGAAAMLMRKSAEESGSVADIALAIGMTERGLARLFQKHLRASPGQYRRKLRLEQAHDFILNTARPLERIAHECGFADGSHLAKQFRREFGHTPSAARAERARVGIH